MKTINPYLTICILFNLICCCLKGQNNENASGESWLNTKYIKCMESKLPCECERSIPGYYAFSIDTNKLSNTFGMQAYFKNSIEYDVIDLQKLNTHHFLAYIKKEAATDTVGYIQYKNGFIIFKDNTGRSTDFKRISGEITELDFAYLKDNIKLLNLALQKRGYPAIEKILSQDSLNFGCNYELASSNAITIEGKSRAWLVKLEKGILLIYEILEGNENKTITFKPKLKLIKSYKW
ncbi:hypothetical protein [Ferruginibacter sp.]